MKVVLIRHGVAEERAAWAKVCVDDGLRPLTKGGRKKMKRAAKGLRTPAGPLDLLATSPLTRAAETAEIVGEAFGIRPCERPELVPSKPPAALLKWLQRQPEDATIALVGHEPHLSLCVSWFLTGLEESVVEMKKGAACLLEFNERVAPGHAKLRWLLTSGQLRKIGR